MTIINEIIAALKDSGQLGGRVLDNGTLLVGHTPHVAPEAWLHVFFHPLTLGEIEWLEG